MPYREWAGPYKRGTTDQYGRFTIRGVAPGGYKAFALKKTDDTDTEDPDYIRPFESKGKSLSLDVKGKQTVQLKLIAVDAENPSK